MNQQLAIQQRQLRTQRVELTSALEQLEDNPETYTMLGSLMIKQDPEETKQRLQKQLDDVQKRLAILEEQMKHGSDADA